MFGELTEKLDGFFSKLRGRGKLTEQDVKSSLREVRRILLEADVNFLVVKSFLKKVEARAVGEEVLKSVTPAQQVIKIIHEEMVNLLGGTWSQMRRSKEPPSVYMIVGLQGSGKTTSTGKLGLHLHRKGMRPLLAACDLQRPAAIDQLERIGEQAGLQVVSRIGDSPLEVALAAKEKARSEGWDTLLVDTAGRLHVDDVLMAELSEMKEQLHPAEVLFVADGMSGQDAVNSARIFSEQLGITGVILTKLDGDARGGAAISVREVTGQPIRYIGVGEKLNDLEEFHPQRMTDRILGMGDVVSLVEKAQQAVETDKAIKLAQKLKKNQFDLEDFLDQIRQLSNMGPLENLLQMIPGAGKAMKGIQFDPKEIKRVEAMILSMTPDERRRPNILNGSRRKRIARGSGMAVQDVNRLINQFEQIKKMMKRMGGMGKKMPKGLGPLFG